MDSEKLISIIVPIYNVEKYLEKCVYSIINQSYKKLEIILVNDGSTDRSGEIAENLSTMDSRIKVYNIRNSGVSNARNYGVNQAIGDYIGFVDSDDYIEKDMYYFLYKLIEKENCDFVECSFNFIYGDKKVPYTKKKYYNILDREGYLSEYLLMNKLYGITCCRLIKSDIAKKISFPRDKVYEDTYYALELIKNIKKVLITNEYYYNYLVRINSITNENFNKRQLDIIEIVKKFKDYTYQNYPYLKQAADNREMYAYFGIFNQIIKLENYKKNEYFYQIYEYFKKNWITILKNPFIDKKRKLATILILINTKIYKKVLINYMKKGIGS